ncbi:MAG: hypothetical protein ABFS38_11215 [Bacteroidota bacterium]
MPGGRVLLAFASGSAKSGLELYSLPVPETGLAMCKAALAKKVMEKGKQSISEVFKISLRTEIGDVPKFTTIHCYAQPDL